MDSVLVKIRLPDQSQKAVKLRENAVVADATNAILNRLDKRVSRHDFRMFAVQGTSHRLLGVEVPIASLQSEKLLLKRLFVPRFIMYEIKQEYSFLAFYLVYNVLRFPAQFQGFDKICGEAFRHYIGEKLSYEVTRQFFQVDFSETCFAYILREVPPYDVQNAEWHILQEISRNEHGFAQFYKAGIVQYNGTRVLQKCILAVQEEGIFATNERGAEIGSYSWFYVKTFGAQGMHFFIESEDSTVWFACLEAEEVAELISGWIARTAARIIV